MQGLVSNCYYNAFSDFFILSFLPTFHYFLCIGWSTHKHCLGIVILFKIWNGIQMIFFLRYLCKMCYIKNYTVIKFKSWNHWEWKLSCNQADVQKLWYLFPFSSKGVHQQYAVLQWYRRTRLSLSKISLQNAWAEGCRWSQKKAGDHPICSPTWDAKQGVLPRVWMNYIALLVPPTVSPCYLKR